MDRRAEVFVGGEGLVRGPADVLATLLHEAAHALAHAQCVQDTSRQGCWYNARFKALAEVVGIEVTKDSRLGLVPDCAPSDNSQGLRRRDRRAGQALHLARAVEVTGSRTRAAPTSLVVCGCGRRLWVGKTMLAAGPILCGLCGGLFSLS